MITVEYCRMMAEYNGWMNERLYQCCLSMEDAERKKDRGAFFGSIHGTLNHILYGDLAFMSRFTGTPKDVPALGVDLYDDFSDLEHARQEMDTRIKHWAKDLTPDWLEQTLTYRSKVDNRARTAPHWVLVTHMFSHETHHRGQITTLLSQMGLDMGSTDIPFMPRFETDISS